MRIQKIVRVWKVRRKRFIPGLTGKVTVSSFEPLSTGRSSVSAATSVHRGKHSILLYDQIMVESVRDENLSDNLALKSKKLSHYADKYKSVNFMFAFCASWQGNGVGQNVTKRSIQCFRPELPSFSETKRCSILHAEMAG